MTPRPHLNDPSLVMEALQAIVPQILQWAGKDAGDEKSAKIILEDLTSVMQSTVQDRDGYARAQRLEKYFQWDADSQLVSILDQIPNLQHRIYDQRVKQWVDDNCILPTLDIGTEVVIEGRKGVIGDILHHEACYHVAFEDRSMSIPYEQVGG